MQNYPRWRREEQLAILEKDREGVVEKTLICFRENVQQKETNKQKKGQPTNQPSKKGRGKFLEP